MTSNRNVDFGFSRIQQTWPVDDVAEIADIEMSGKVVAVAADNVPVA
jgi:hypothetical protein